MAREKKAFKDTKVGRWLHDNAPDILDSVGNAFPPAKLLADVIAPREDISDDDKATFAQHLEEYEMELRYHQQNTQSARDIYASSKDISDKLAKTVMHWNLPLIFVLVAVQIACTMWLDSIMLGIVGPIIGMAMNKLFEERSVIMNFFFGSSKGSKEKDNILNYKDYGKAS